MALASKIAVALGVAAFAFAAAPAATAQTATPNDMARFLAGLQPSAHSPLAALTQDPAWQQHAQFLDKIWAGLEDNQLSKVKAWSRTNLTKRQPVTYYFFSGPDFLYADAFLPNASTYILAGLEPIGELPDVAALQRTLPRDLAALRFSLSTLISRSYFITSYMGSDLSASQLRGTLPPLYVFLARTGKTIHDVSFVSVGSDGREQAPSDTKDTGARGVKIVFSDGRGKRQSLYYFRTDLSNKGVQSSGFLEFCRQFGLGDIFIKAASYLLHTGAFSTVRDFLLDQGATVVQDDTGIPLKYFEQRGWQVQPFGRYVGPIAVFRGNFQNKLKGLFERSGAPPIDFGIGYRWRLNESHVLLATNANPQGAPVVASPRPEKAPEKAAPEKTTASPQVIPPAVLTDKAPEKPASSAPIKQPPTAPNKDAKAKKAAPPPPEPVAEASRFTSWPSLLFGGLFSAALVGIFGLEGLAQVLGFLLQVATLAIFAWAGFSYYKSREQQAAVAGVDASGNRAAQWPTAKADATQPSSDEANTKAWPSGLAARLRRWTS